MYTVDPASDPASRGTKSLAIIGDNFRMVTGPEADQAIAAHLAGQAPVGPRFDREPFPAPLVAKIKRLSAAGYPPGKVACWCSSIHHATTKNAVLRVLAGGNC